MGCERYEPHLTAYVDRELSDKAHAVIERHLRDCPACRQVVEELKEACTKGLADEVARIISDFTDQKMD